MKIKLGDTIRIMLPTSGIDEPQYIGPLTVEDIFEDGDVKILALENKK